MNRDSDCRPVISRPDAGIAVVTRWMVSDVEIQRALVEAIAAWWKGTPWPQGLLSVYCLTSTDGTSVVTYSQWTSETAWQESNSESLIAPACEFPGIERGEPVAYQLYRGSTRDGAPAPGCVVLVSVQFDGPDKERQKRWIDAVFEALESEPKLPEGGISGYFHVSLDGTRVLNYAEWTSEEAHREALEKSGQEAMGPNPKWRIVQTYPGIASSRVGRYKVAHGLSIPVVFERVA